MGVRRRQGRDVNGILLLDKPRGLSSNEVLQRAKRTFDAMKAGHTGNLDVQASGLLPICFGEATKVCQFLLEADKRYISEFTLGQRTTTGDCEGEVTSTRPTSGLTLAAVEAAVAGFRGQISQIPPMHSALKRNGQPLYKLAHQGIEVERESRQVTIHAFDVLSFENPRLVVDVRCSKGTYIRTLAEDLGEALGCGGFVSALRREQAGPYLLSAASSFDNLDECGAAGPAALDALLLPVDSALGGMPRVELSDDAVFYFARGQAVQVVAETSRQGLLRLYDASARFIGVGEMMGDGRIAPRRLFRPQPVELAGDLSLARA